MDTRYLNVFQGTIPDFNKEQQAELNNRHYRDSCLMAKVDAMLLMIKDDPIKYKDLETLIIKDVDSFMKEECSNGIALGLFNKMVYQDIGSNFVGILEYEKVIEYMRDHIEDEITWINKYRNKLKMYIRLPIAPL